MSASMTPSEMAAALEARAAEFDLVEPHTGLEHDPRCVADAAFFRAAAQKLRQMDEALARLGSGEAFVVSRSLDPFRDAELISRMEFARAARMSAANEELADAIESIISMAHLSVAEERFITDAAFRLRSDANRIKAMNAALAPFADEAESFTSQADDAVVPMFSFTYGDLRAAARAIMEQRP